MRFAALTKENGCLKSSAPDSQGWRGIGGNDFQLKRSAKRIITVAKFSSFPTRGISKIPQGPEVLMSVLYLTSPQCFLIVNIKVDMRQLEEAQKHCLECEIAAFRVTKTPSYWTIQHNHTEPCQFLPQCSILSYFNTHILTKPYASQPPCILNHASL